MEHNVTIIKKDRPADYLISGTVFLFLWGLSQMVPADRVFYYMDIAVEHLDSGYILASAVLLVLINSMRAIALYLGWFLIGEGLTRSIPVRNVPSWVIPMIAIPLSYSLLSSLGKGIVPHFGMPAVLSMASVLILHYMTRNVSGWYNKALVLALFILSFQWLDIIPMLTSYGAGWGELSMSVKNLAVLMEREMVLNISGITLFSSLFLGGMVTSELLVAYSSRLRHLSLLRENEKKLALLREENIRSRGAVELQQLVHDLKRPLTTITGLTDVILSLDDPREIWKHTSVVAKASENMNGMISELLHASSRRTVTVSDLVNYTKNQISPFEWKDHVRVYADEGIMQKQISVNLIRLSRALVNLLDNSRRAVEDSSCPDIGVYIGLNEDSLIIQVSDNGPGFGPVLPVSNLSGWNSTGIGLGFVRQVVEDHRGKMFLSDLAAGGGEVEIRLPFGNTVTS